MDSKKWKGAVSAHENLKSFIKIFRFPHTCVMPSTNLEKDRNAASEKNWLDLYSQVFFPFTPISSVILITEKQQSKKNQGKLMRCSTYPAGFRMT